jgi:hypothetical protein
MVEFTEFTVEGDAVLGYNDDGSSVTINGKRVETIIAEALGFPSSDEFDAMINRLSSLRQQGLMPVEDEPDITREGLRLSIEVKVI